jgi:short-subunit dehydrogenase
MKKFSDKVVWITGASSGIGYELAKSFHEEGAFLALSARRLERLQDLQQILGSRAKIYELDVQNKDQVFITAQNIVSDFGKLDVVIANAGYSVVGSFVSTQEIVWRRLFDTNVFGVIWTLQAAIPYVKLSRGHLAIMSSIAGKIGIANTSAYAASKFALMGLSNALYQELYKDGVSVSIIAPGIIESEISLVDNYGQLNLERRDKRSKYFMWSAQKAAKYMVKKLFLRKREIIVTNHGKFGDFLVRYFPNFTYWLLARLGFTSRKE